MNLNPISLVSSLWQSASASTTSNTVAPVTRAAKTVDNSSISTPAELFGQLSQLSKNNPAEFKSLTAQIAQQLQAAAASATDSSQAGHLKQLASNFQNASQSGNFSDLFANSSQSAGTQVQTSHSGHHHHHASSQTSSTADSDTVTSIFQQALSSIQGSNKA